MSKMTKVIAALGVVAGLGVAAMPLSSYAETVTKTAQVDVYATVDNALSITAEAAKVDLGNIALGSMKTSDPVTITVATNAASYDLTIQGLNGDNKMHTVGEFDVLETGDKAATIPAGDLTGTASSWGYQLVGTAGYKAIPGENADTIPAVDGDATNGTKGVHSIIFGVRVSDDQAEGTYKGSVVFTATAGN